MTKKNPISKANRGRSAGLISGLLIIFLGLFAADSFAHQQKAAVTRILFNSNTGNIEVMHRFYVHDAEHAATLIFGERQTLMESAESRQLFGSYVINRFAIEATYASGDAETLSLEYIGEEIDGQFIWVYQEIPQREPITAMTIVDLALRDIWPEQTNLVSIERDGQFYSLEFSGNDEALSIDLGD